MSDRSIDRASGNTSPNWSSEPLCSEGPRNGESNAAQAAAFFGDGVQSPGVLKLLESYRAPARNQCAAPIGLANISAEPDSPSAPVGQIDETAGPPGASEAHDDDSVVSTVATWVNEHPRVMGGLKAVGGAAETVVGGAAILAPEPTAITKVVGVAAVAHGLDTFQSGFHQFLSGTNQRTLTSEGLELAAVSMGVDPEHAAVGAELADAALGVGLSLGAGALSSTGNVAAVTNGQRAAAAASKDGDALEAVRSWWLRGAEGDAAWRATSASDQFFYELGQKTLTDANWQRFAHITDPVERGKAIWEAQGAGALMSEGHGLVCGAGKTLGTGPTPGVRALAEEGSALIGTGGSVSHAVDTSSHLVDDQ